MLSRIVREIVPRKGFEFFSKNCATASIDYFRAGFKFSMLTNPDCFYQKSGILANHYHHHHGVSVVCDYIYPTRAYQLPHFEALVTAHIVEPIFVCIVSAPLVEDLCPKCGKKLREKISSRTTLFLDMFE